MASELDKRTVALELAYQRRMGKLDMDPSAEEEAREWAEQNCMEFAEEAERLLTKLESPL